MNPQIISEESWREYNSKHLLTDYLSEVNSAFWEKKYQGMSPILLSLFYPPKSDERPY